MNFSSSWILVPLIGGFIGWITNWIAVKMLFHPREPVRVLGITFQGVFPARQAALAQKFGKVVGESLVSFDEIKGHLRDPSIKARVSSLVDSHIDRAIRERLPQIMPMVSMFLTPSLIETVKKGFSGDLDSLIDHVIESVSGRMSELVNIEEIVRVKVAAFSSDRLEEMLVAIMKKEFRFIELIGGVLGFVIGFVQVVIAIYL